MRFSLLLLASAITVALAAPTPAPEDVSSANLLESRSSTSCKKTSTCKNKVPDYAHRLCHDNKCTFACNKGYSKNSKGNGCTKSKSSGSSSKPAVVATTNLKYTGEATWYTQDGGQGSCGWWKSDSDHIVAVTESMMNSGLCGKTVTITNTANGKSVNAIVADTCPGCARTSLDLSTSTFQAIGSLDSGVLNIKWGFA